MIHSSEISFVIQGPFSIGKNNYSTEDSARSIRKYFPDSPIIFSTWEIPNTSQFWDLLHLGQDPGPGPKYYLDDRTAPDNINRQILSSQNGLKYVTTPYAVKLRSDLFFNSSNLLSQISTQELSQSRYIFTKKSILTAANLTYNPLRPNAMLYHPCDWFLAGDSDDLREYFNIPFATNSDYSYHKFTGIPADYQHPISSRYSDEQFILVNNLIKKRLEIKLISDAYDRNIESLIDCIHIFASNFKFIPSSKLGFNSFKYPIKFYTSIRYHYTYREANHLQRINFDHHSSCVNTPSFHRLFDSILNATFRSTSHCYRFVPDEDI